MPKLILRTRYPLNNNEVVIPQNNYMSEDILGSAIELNVAKEEKVAEETKVEETKVETKTEAETLESLENLAEKADDAIPLKKYMAEKNARRDVEAKARELEAELTALRNSPLSKDEVKLDVRSLSEKHNIDEEALRDILQASYNMSKEKIKAELEREINPKLAEFETLKKDKEKQAFEAKFANHLELVLKDMPEYTELIDQNDLKTWIKSGQYSKLNLPQLIEQKYGKFVVGKKSIESGYNASRETEMPDMKNLTDKDYARLETDPEFKKEWAKGLPDRLRSYL